MSERVSVWPTHPHGLEMHPHGPGTQVPACLHDPGQGPPCPTSNTRLREPGSLTLAFHVSWQRGDAGPWSEKRPPSARTCLSSGSEQALEVALGSSGCGARAGARTCSLVGQPQRGKSSDGALQRWEPATLVLVGRDKDLDPNFRVGSVDGEWVGNG